MAAKADLLGIILLAVDPAVAQEARRLGVQRRCADAAAQTRGVPRAAAHLQHEAVRDAHAARAAHAVLRLRNAIVQMRSVEGKKSWHWSDEIN